MKMRIIVRTVHKWIGWLSGILVIFLGITGCLLVFESEIRDFVEPFQFIEKSDKPFLPPSVLLDAAEKCMNGKKAQAIEYRGNRRSGVVSFYDEASYHLSSLISQSFYRRSA
ncbi:MAG: PepSY domain-containing protein [Tannerella sp.]|jgi:uncharacterized iron-regulated membrane protein|nr:PepSY domain-containing protein [Tannerella sp.]